MLRNDYMKHISRGDRMNLTKQNRFSFGAYRFMGRKAAYPRVQPHNKSYLSFKNEFIEVRYKHLINHPCMRGLVMQASSRTWNKFKSPL